MAMAADPDVQLMLRVKQGERDAFIRLFRRYMNPLHHFVFRFVGNAAVAEELVQEIFLKIHRAAGSYEPRGRFTTYLYRVATNHCLNEVRRASYKEQFSSIEQMSEGPPGRPGIELPDTDHVDVESRLMDRDTVAKLQEFINGLPENQRAALLLNRLEALSYQEIADVLDVSVGAVKSLLHRARNTLKEKLEQWKEVHETV